MDEERSAEELKKKSEYSGPNDFPVAEDVSALQPEENVVSADQKAPSEEEVSLPVSALDLDDEINHKHTNNAKKSRKKTWSFLLFIAANVIVIAITAMFEFGGNKANDGSKLSDIAASISKNWYYLLGAFGCFLGIYFFQVLKVTRMLRVTTGKSHVRATINSVILGKYYDNITPLAIGGQPFQAYYLSQNDVPVGVATAAPIAQLFLGTLGFITIAIAAFIFYSGEAISPVIRVCAYIGLGINSLTPIAIVFLSVLPNLTTSIVSFFIKIFAKLHIVKDAAVTTKKAIGTINDYRTSLGFMSRSKSTIIIGYLLSILEKISEMSITFFVIMACFNGQGNYLQITALTIFIYAATSFIPTPGTAGAAEGSFYIVFGSFWPMFIWRLFSYYSYLLFGLIFIIANGARRAAARKKEGQQTNNVP